MAYKTLYIFLEGSDDERLFEAVIVSLFNQYDNVKIIKHCQMKNNKVNSFIKSINCIDFANYIFVVDHDKECLQSTKAKFVKKYNQLDKSKILVVEKEIESWYLAFMNDDFLKKNKIKICVETNSLTKEKFDKMIPKTYNSRIDFLIESLKNFDLCLGMKRNRSIEYFFRKYNITNCFKQDV